LDKIIPKNNDRKESHIWKSTEYDKYALPGQEKIPFIKITRSNEMMQTENYRRPVGGA
jgi:hypothetical protein